MTYFSSNKHRSRALIGWLSAVGAVALITCTGASAQPSFSITVNPQGPGMVVVPPPAPPPIVVAPPPPGPGYYAPPPGAYAPGSMVVRCESFDGHYQVCRTPFHRPAVLIRQISQVRCIPGRTYGSLRPGRMWVDRGCRGDFGAH